MSNVVMIDVMGKIAVKNGNSSTVTLSADLASAPLVSGRPIIVAAGIMMLTHKRYFFSESRLSPVFALSDNSSPEYSNKSVLLYILVIFENSGHSPMFEEPELFSNKVIEFINQNK